MKNIGWYKIVKKYKEGSVIQKISYWILLLHLILVLFAKVIANEKPLFCICNKQWYFPALSTHDIHSIDFRSSTCTFKIKPLIAWSSGTIDPKSSGYAAPFKGSGDHIHLLGTDSLGRDVLAGLIYGTRYAWTVGLLSTLFALLPGVFIGMMIGYWKNEKLKWTWVQSIFALVWTFLFFYEWKVLMWLLPTLYQGIASVILIIFWYSIAAYTWNFAGRFGKKITIPIDSVIMRAIDIFESFPKLLLLMALMIALSRPSVLTLAILIALIRWTLFVQMTRGETIKESVSNYVLAAENINIPWYRILIRHIWPNIKSGVWVTAVFTFSASVLIEASLSFIGLGLRLERVTWGSLLNEGRQYLPGWWLSVFPGLAIFSLLFALNWLFIIKTGNEKTLGSNNA